MPTTTNPASDRGPESPAYDTSNHPSSTSVPVRGYPGEKPEGATEKNGKTPETSEETKGEQVAGKAAHKTAKHEQEYDKKNTTVFTK